MHCYRVTTFSPEQRGDYVLVPLMDKAFALAREHTTPHRSPVVALIDLPIAKADIIALANDPDGTIGKQPSLKAWEFIKRGTQAIAREIEPGSGEPKSKGTYPPKHSLHGTDQPARKVRVHPTVKAAAKTNPSGWPQVMIKNPK
jgi:hypothetical protein